MYTIKLYIFDCESHNSVLTRDLMHYNIVIVLACVVTVCNFTILYILE